MYGQGSELYGCATGLGVNPGAVSEELERILSLLWSETEALADIAQEAAKAEVAHKTRRAQALLRASGTVAEREAVADVETEREHLERRITEAKLLVQREVLRSLQIRVDGLRSIGAGMRAAV